MAAPAPAPKIRLSRLRDIGWSLWDPIGLLPPGAKWDDESSRAFANEYDSYLLEAAGMLRQGSPKKKVAKYLSGVESGHMGLGIRQDTNERARSVVEAIKADTDLWTEQGE